MLCRILRASSMASSWPLPLASWPPTSTLRPRMKEVKEAPRRRVASWYWATRAGARSPARTGARSFWRMGGKTLVSSGSTRCRSV